MRLLLAEDERSLARALTVLLRKNNYEVDAVYDGEEAMAYLGSGNYDGAILDIMMPKRDGIDVLCQLRRQGNRLPVLLLTAKSEVDDKVLGPVSYTHLVPRRNEGPAGKSTDTGGVYLHRLVWGGNIE